MQQQKLRRDYENPGQTEFRFTSQMIAEWRKFQKEEKLWHKKIDIRNCWEAKQENPELSLRQLAEEYKVSKDTIKKWVGDYGRNIAYQVKEWEEKTRKDAEYRFVNEVYPDDEKKEGLEYFGPEWKKHLIRVAKSLGVKEKDFDAWIDMAISDNKQYPLEIFEIDIANFLDGALSEHELKEEEEI